MKLIVLFTAILLVGQPTEAQKILTADEILNPAFEKAKRENKHVLVIFHASWCGWCRKMDASLADKTISSQMEKNYVVAHLTVYESPDKKNLENNGALDFLTKYGGADKGLPYWFVFNSAAELKADSQYLPGKNTGCPASEEEVKYFCSVLQKTSALTKEDLDLVKTRFRKNEQ